MLKKRIATNIQSDSSSLDHGIESDFTNSVGDFSLPPVRRKVLGSRQVSFSIENKLSFDSLDLQQTSSGYGSLLSSSSSLSPHKSLSLTPKKRKSDPTDENAFYNSYQFVSPSKNRRTDEKRAKLTLQQKSASENVFSCSTPNKISKSKWGKSRSMHPDKFGTGRNLQSPVSSSLVPPAEISFECSSFDISGSFNLTESHSNDSPGNLQQLLMGKIVVSQPKTNASPVEKVSQSQENLSGCSTITPVRTYFYCGRLTLDILEILDKQKNEAFDKIFSHLDEIDLLSLSHVSQQYRNMIKSNKTLEPKRQNYLKAFRKIKENQIPGNRTLPPKLKTNKKKQGKFGDSNVNHSMQLRPKPQSPPVSPSKKKFHDNQKVRFVAKLIQLKELKKTRKNWVSTAWGKNSKTCKNGLKLNCKWVINWILLWQSEMGWNQTSSDHKFQFPSLIKHFSYF